MSNQNFNSTYTVNVSADPTPVRQDCTFTHMLVRTADYDFEMSLDGSSWFPMAQGEAFGPLPTKQDVIYLRSLNGNAQAITFRCSNVMNVNSRLNIIHDANQVLSVGAKIPATYMVCSNYNLAAGTEQNIIGVNAGNNRKDIIITNLDAASVLTVQNAVGGSGAVVWPQDNLPLETSDTVKIRNDTGAAIAVLILEIYYAP